MFKKVISLLVLFLYLHGMSGYTMSIHTCTITGSANVLTGYGNLDPCSEDEHEAEDSQQTSTHFERADCCAMENTVVNIDDDSNISSFKINFITAFIASYIPVTLYAPVQEIRYVTMDVQSLSPPGPEELCVFRI